MVEGKRLVEVTGSAASATTDDERPTTAMRVGVGLDALNRIAPWLIGAFALAYCLLFTMMAVYWRDHLRWGFDIVVYAQPIWNTAHGRIWELSIYNFTHTELGHDFVPMELILAPFYRLFGGNMSLIVAQSATVALGGIGVYAIARQAMPKIHRIIPVLFGVLYLSLLFIQNANLEKIHLRNFVMWTWFFAWLGYRTNRTWLVWTMLLLALTARSDVSLVVFMFGVLCLIERRRWTLSWLPMIVGALWFVGVVYILVPHFSTRGFVYEDNYRWLGGGLSGMIRSALTRPLYVLRGVFTAAKLRYTFDLLFPFAFLPLLKPRILLIPLPIYALNILSNYAHQYTIQAHYQALIVPWLAIAAVEAVADIVERRGWAGGRLAARWDRAGWRRRMTANASRTALALVGLMLVFSIAQQETITSPIQSYLLHHGPNARAVAGRQLIAMVPNDAPLAITQKLAGNTPDRRSIYAFPGDPEYESPALVNRADYIIGDERLSTDEAASIARYRADPAWEVMDERGGFILMRKRQPGSGA
ncbi:MAG TPA: DUF2079 domain-containing protein [Thermomicrobiales bacterium]|jgi:uncharacterized membrane protein